MTLKTSFTSTMTFCGKVCEFNLKMAEVREDSSSSAKVRDLIFAYECQSSSTEPLELYEGRQRAKSIGNALSYKLFRQPTLEIHNIVDIEKELVKIEAHLNYYEVYEKETHVAFQEQLFNVLTSIVSIDPDGHESTIQIKRELIGETQKLARVLNGKLPFDGNHSYRGVRRTYSNVVRKEEAIVSTTSVRTQEHTTTLSSSQSTLNGGFVSEESLSSTKDSIDLSARQEDSSSVDFNKVEERPQSASPPPQKKIVPEAESSYVPSVSKLKKFFSFRRDTRPEVKVISAAYSGVTRSQSLNLKSNKYTATRREKHEETKKKEEIISENDEDLEDPNNQRLITSSPIESKDETVHENNQQGNVEISLYVEPASEIEEYREVQRGSQHNVSVSKLKSLFEDKRKETDEGNYMNFTGLLRNVDIHKQDLNKSKSMSDLKSDSLRYELKDIDIDDDLSKEIDDDDDFEHVSISVGKEDEELNNNNVSKADEILHSTHISEDQEVTNLSSETFISGKVGVLKKSFESRTTGSTTEHKNEDIKHLIHRTIDPITNPKSDSEEPPLKVPIQLRTGFAHVSHSKEVIDNRTKNKVVIEKEVESVSNEPKPILQVPFPLKVDVENASHNQKTEAEGSEHVAKVEENVTTGTVETLKQTFEHSNAPVLKPSSKSEEPLLKIPIQLRTGFTNVSRSEEVIESSSRDSISERVNKDIEHLIHRTIEPIPNTASESGEPVLKIPIQLRTGFSHVGHTEEITGNNIVAKEVEDASIRSEPIPIQLRVGNVNSHIVGNAKIESNEHVVKEEENIPSGTVETLKQTFESGNSDSVIERVNKDVEHLIHRTVEPIPNTASKPGEPVLKIPIQLRTGFTNVSHSEGITGNAGTEGNEHVVKEEETSGTVEMLKQTFVSESSNSDSISERVNENIEHLIHRTVEPIPNTASKSGEPVLKIPIQLRTGFAHVSNSEEITGNNVVVKRVENESVTSEPIVNIPIQLRVGDVNTHIEENAKIESNKQVVKQEENVTSGTVETLKQTFVSSNSDSISERVNKDIEHLIHRTVEPIPNTASKSEEPVLKIPIQLRTGFTHVSNSEEITGTAKIESNKHVVEEEENIISGTVETLKQTFERSNSDSISESAHKDIEHLIHRTVEPIPNTASKSKEPVLKIPIQLRTGFTHVSHSEEITGNNEVVKEVKDASITSEPRVNIPIQLRAGDVTTHIEGNVKIESNEHVVKEEENITSGTVETLKQTFEGSNSESISKRVNKDIEHLIHKTVEPIPYTASKPGDPVLKIPIQLRTGFTHVSHSEEITGNSLDNTVVRQVEDTSETSEPILKIPIQLRVGGLNTSHNEDDVTTESNDYMSIVKAEENVSSGTVETLKQTFENSSDSKVVREVEDAADKSEPLLEIPIQLRVGGLNTSHIEEHLSTRNGEGGNKEIHHVLHRTIQPISSTDTSLEEPILKTPIQLRTGFSTSSHIEEQVVEHSTSLSGNTSFNTKDQEKSLLKIPVQIKVDDINSQDISNEGSSNSSISVDRSVNISSGSVEVLTQTFENLSRTNSQDNSDDVKNVIHRTIEPVAYNTDGSDERVLKIPIQLRTSLGSSEEVLQNETKETGHINHNRKIAVASSQESTSAKTVLKVPVQLRIEGDVATYDNTALEQEAVPFGYYGNQSGSEGAESIANATQGRAQIESKTQSFMKILESPTAFSTLVSSSSYGQSQQASSTSKVSVSYSQKTTMQHTSSTQVSHRIVSSSSSSHSSDLLSQNYPEVLKDPYLALPSRNISNDEDVVTITEVEDDDYEKPPKINLNVSQENIIDEILKDTDSLENVDEEFEKMLQENK